MGRKDGDRLLNGLGFSFGMMKVLLELAVRLHNMVNVLNAMKLYTLKWLLSRHVNFTSLRVNSQPQEGQAQGWSSVTSGSRASKASGRLPSCFWCVCVMRTPHGGNVAADNSRVHAASQISRSL